MTPGRTSRALTRLATIVALAITVLPPAGYFLVEREGLHRSLIGDAKVQAIELTNVVGRNSGIWEEAHERLIEAIDPISYAHRETRIFTLQGRLITEKPAHLHWPRVTHVDQFYDFGVPAGRVEVSDSLFEIVINTLLVLVASSALGFIVYVPLRKMPEKALRRAAESLVRSELSRSLVDGLDNGVILTDEQMLVITANGSATRLNGLTQPIAEGVRLTDCFCGAVGEDGQTLTAEQWPMRQCLDKKIPVGPLVIGLTGRPDHPVWLSLKCRPVSHGEDGELTAVVTSIEDITAQKKAREWLQITERAIQSSRDAIMITDAETRIISVNEAFCAITGYDNDKIIGERANILNSGRQDRDFYRAMWAEIADKGSWSGEVWDRRQNGKVFPAWLSISEIRESHEIVTHYLGTLFDLTERIKAEQDVRHLALHDALTGLPNRTHLRESLTQGLAAAERHAWRVGVFFIDLDRFKLINDTLGHEAGDAVLQEVARRLRLVLRDEDSVARLGGDEFVVVISKVESDASLVTVAENILQTMGQSFNYNNNELFVTTSIGIVAYPQDGTDVDTLLSSADTAMYAAKADGRANYKFFAPDMNEAGRHHLEVTRAVRSALERNEFVLHYQPQVLANDYQQTVGAEALIRWNHPDKGLIMPGQFIPVIEGTRLIIDVGAWVIDTALRQAHQWHLNGLSVCISVNVSALQFKQDGFINSLRAAAARHQFIPGSIRIELTESLMVSDPEATITRMEEIRREGFLLSIDDFGTGYSSLSYLSRFPFDELKIDKSFVSRLTRDLSADAIVNAIIVLGHALNLHVIAEGVEAEAEAARLRELGCDHIQGYFFGKPMSAADLEKRLQTPAMINRLSKSACTDDLMPGTLETATPQ